MTDSMADLKDGAGLRLVGGRDDNVDERAPQLKRYVRITERMANGFVAFDFAVGSPDLFVELILPETAFEQFCINNHAEHMTEEQSAIVDQEMEKWRYGDEGLELKRSAQELRESDQDPE